MNRWKMTTACLMAAALTVAGPAGTCFAGSPEFARTPEEWAALQDNNMDYGELADLIHEYNVTVQNNQRDYNKNKNKTKEDIAQDYRDAAAAMRDSVSGGDDAASIMADAMALAQAAAMEQQADENVDDSEILKMSYDQMEATLVSTAQTNMIQYHENMLELQYKQKNRELLDARYQSAQVGKNAGTGTQMEVLTALQNLQNADADILATQTQTENTRQKLCVMLGWRYDAAPVIGEIPAVDMERITAMNPEADKALAVANNYTLRINQRKLSNSNSNSEKDKLQLTINDNIQKIGTSLDSAYRTVLQSRTAYDQAAAELALEEKKMAAASQQIGLGAISPLAFKQQECAYLEKQIGLQKAELVLFQAMETYDWAVKGLAEA